MNVEILCYRRLSNIELKIEKIISELLTGEAQKNALEFAAHLRANEMVINREVGGYWDDKFYYAISYNGGFVCFILISNAASVEDSAEPWVVWSDDSGSGWFAYFPLGEHLKEIAWKNVDICAGASVCGGCNNPGGTCKTIFGKEFESVCRTTFRFDNPDAMATECLKKMVEIRKNDILRKN